MSPFETRVGRSQQRGQPASPKSSPEALNGVRMSSFDTVPFAHAICVDSILDLKSYFRREIRILNLPDVRCLVRYTLIH